MDTIEGIRDLFPRGAVCCRMRRIHPAINPSHCSVIKKTRDAYIKRLNGIYGSNLEKVGSCIVG